MHDFCDYRHAVADFRANLYLRLCHIRNFISKETKDRRNEERKDWSPQTVHLSDNGYEEVMHAYS